MKMRCPEHDVTVEGTVGYLRHSIDAHAGAAVRMDYVDPPVDEPAA